MSVFLSTKTISLFISNTCVLDGDLVNPLD